MKGTGISVTENLTLKRMERLKKAREQHGFANVLTLNGKIMFKGNDGNFKNLLFLSGFRIAYNVWEKTAQLRLVFTMFRV